MKKVLKNILKWLLCVFITFTVVFTVSQFSTICLGVYFTTGFLGNHEKQMEILGEESIKWHEEITDRQFDFDYGNKDDIMVKLYSEYPSGVTRVMCMLTYYMSYGELTIISLILGIIIGTAIYMLQDVDKKGLKIVIILYVLSIAILGFVQGFMYTDGEDVLFLDEWEFPSEFITPVSIAFALVVIVRFIRQKDIAKKLNEKLKKIKEEKK